MLVGRFMRSLCFVLLCHLRSIWVEFDTFCARAFEIYSSFTSFSSSVSLRNDEWERGVWKYLIFPFFASNIYGRQRVEIAETCEKRKIIEMLADRKWLRWRRIRRPRLKRKTRKRVWKLTKLQIKDLARFRPGHGSKAEYPEQRIEAKTEV